MFGMTIESGRIHEKENDRLEFKTALKGIPGSTWETYSAFANSFGGTILLGIQDNTGIIEGVPNAELRVQEIWNTLDNPQVVNNNILHNDDVYVVEYEEKQIIVINVPRADRYIRPIYYKRMESGTFKRNGEGDYRCTLPEIASMIRDQSTTSYDSTIVEKTSFEDIDVDTLRLFRNEMRVVQPDHMWNKADNEDFVKKIGAVNHLSGQLTLAGLLMFGKEEIISAFFPYFKLDYMECPVKNTAWTYRKVTGDGLGVCNIYNFFSSIRGRISSDVDQPLKIDSDMHRIVDTDVHKAIRECLLNSLVHADYLGNLVVKVEKYPKKIVVTNSGLFRIPVDIAERGGESDPRNMTIAKMFSLIGLSERAGVGINFIFETWINEFGDKPTLIQDTNTQRTSIILDLTKKKYNDVDEKIIKLIKADSKISMESISERMDMSRPAVSNHIKHLKSIGVLTRIGGTRGHWIVN